VVHLDVDPQVAFNSGDRIDSPRFDTAFDLQCELPTQKQVLGHY